MTGPQHKKYFRLWAAACRVRGWKSSDQVKRREVTLAATNQESSRDLDEAKITRLFKYLDWLADPLNLDKAILAANPEVAEDENTARQLVYVIRETAAKAGLDEAYLAVAAKGKCRVNHCKTWSELPLPALRQFVMTVSARASKARNRPAKAMQADCSAPEAIQAAPDELEADLWQDDTQDGEYAAIEADSALPAWKCPF